MLYIQNWKAQKSFHYKKSLGYVTVCSVFKHCQLKINMFLVLCLCTCIISLVVELSSEKPREKIIIHIFYSIFSTCYWTERHLLKLKFAQKSTLKLIVQINYCPEIFYTKIIKSSTTSNVLVASCLYYTFD